MRATWEVNVVFARKSGSFTRFFLEGSLPRGGDSWIEGFRRNRFESIEGATSEGESVGWVSPGDPTGTRFEAEDCLVGDAIAARIRVDRKRVPSKWMWIHMTAELAERERERITAREKRELKEKVSKKILPRVLPSVTLVDVLFVPRRKEALLFATSGTAVETFQGLLLRTFEMRAIAADPRQTALRMGLSPEREGYLDQCSPTTFTAPCPVESVEPIEAVAREASA